MQWIEGSQAQSAESTNLTRRAKIAVMERTKCMLEQMLELLCVCVWLLCSVVC
jgi:hypothetical protein